MISSSVAPCGAVSPRFASSATNGAAAARSAWTSADVMRCALGQRDGDVNAGCELDRGPRRAPRAQPLRRRPWRGDERPWGPAARASRTPCAWRAHCAGQRDAGEPAERDVIERRPHRLDLGEAVPGALQALDRDHLREVALAVQRGAAAHRRRPIEQARARRSSGPCARREPRGPGRSSAAAGSRSTTPPPRRALPGSTYRPCDSM